MQHFKKCIFFLFVLLPIVSCNKSETQELLVSEEKMISILVDLHIAEAAILSANKVQKDSIGGVYYQQIFDMHQIPDSLFYRNLEIISNNPIKTEEIYEKVIEKLEKLNLGGNKSPAEKKDEVGTKKK